MLQPKKCVLSAKFSSKYIQVARYLNKFVQIISREITKIFSTAVFWQYLLKAKHEKKQKLKMAA